jgi:hypothetical protein
VKTHAVILSFLITSPLFSQNFQSECGTPDPSQAEIEAVQQRILPYYDTNSRTPDDDPVNIKVAWHVITSSTGEGNLTDSQIQSAVEDLNQQYNEVFNFYFTLGVITRHENDDWFYFDLNENSSQGSDEQQMRSQTYTDPIHYYNVWSIQTTPFENGSIVAGWNYFPFNSSEGSYWQGTTINHNFIFGGTLEHEAGHYFGLFHTFQGGCTGGDDVDDTPAMSDEGINSCNQNQDTCPDIEGLDPVTNVMNYSDCKYDFTPGQAERAYAITEEYHPGLLENEFLYPNLGFVSAETLGDTDSDGVLNPGETSNLKVEIINYWGADADSILVTLSTVDERLVILDSTIQFLETLSFGESSNNPETDMFQIQALDGITMGTIDCNLNLRTPNGDRPYEIDIPIEISINLNQRGFPIEGMVIKSSPIIADLDNNNTNDVFYGSDNGGVYGFMVEGLSMFGFPFSTDGDVRSSPAVADLENDGSNEIMFGSNDGTLYVLNSFGAEVISYQQSGMINGSPAVVDLDQDGDREIIFVSYNGTNSDGEVHAIHHDGTEVDGFPVDLDERMMAGPAAGDLDGDGYPEIIVCTWGENIYSIGYDGSIQSGFPFESTKRFNAPATLVDLDGDSDLEIIAGNDDGLLHVLHHDGTEMTSYDVGDDIRGGVSVADLNDDGNYELLFTGYDDMIHVWNPIDGEELEGWPVDIESNSLTEPVTADLDNDGDLEVVTARKSGMAYVFHHDATLYNNFPASLGGDIESSPAIGDIDGDGDFELVFGTTGGLKVIDIKEEMGERVSWKLHRGNLERTGSLGMTLVSNDSEEGLTPSEFYVSANYPNPFNPSTMIDIETVEASELTVSVFDAKGRMVNNLVNSYLEAGRYSVKWNGMDASGMSMPTGVYFIRVQSGLEMHTQKMILIK